MHVDLLSIVEVLWRHRRLTIPVLVVTALAAFYVAEIKPPVYESTSTILLTNPPAQATKSQIAEDPSLMKVNPYNTFTSYGDLQVIANALIDLVDSPASQPALLSAGVNPSYQLELSTDYGDPPIIDITGDGASAQTAITSAQVLTRVVASDLTSLQQREGVNQFYMIKADTILRPSTATKSSSGKLRSLIAVLGVGIILLFIVVSAADMTGKSRRTARRSGATGADRQRVARPRRELRNHEPEPVANAVPWHAEGIQ
jgi:capsular polysaccharide biosynthesis protein